MRIIDVFLYEGYKVIYRFALAFLKMKEKVFISNKKGIFYSMNTIKQLFDDLDCDELFKVALTDGEKDIILGASSGKGIRFSESDVRPMGRISAGVRGILVEDPAIVVGMAVVNTDGDEIVIVTDKGYGKRTNVDAFRVQVRGGKGVKALNLTAKNGNLAAILTVRGDEDLMVVTDKGMIIRTHLDQILTIGRDTQGVRVILLNEGQKVSNIAIVPRQEEENEEDFTNEFDDEYELDLDYKFMDENNQEDE